MRNVSWCRVFWRTQSSATASVSCSALTLTKIARDGARRMLPAALRAVTDAFVAQHSEEPLPDGHERVVR